ncbi:hypothetical protein EJ06DRAFT_306105 [Trichodelitschia bisporula]|uniref:Uncharacterized protein n=1 Tax=Trichodelitschia bisporula TaxID=703511 RepID=A0A6G1I301_9PEZI|nr:hypothetical protein EJ06DRAFT_306105 [Trichodelitschia bisporula]
MLRTRSWARVARGLPRWVSLRVSSLPVCFPSCFSSFILETIQEEKDKVTTRMPFLSHPALPTSASGTWSPLKANLEDMRAACGALDVALGCIREDGECYGLLSEEAYCYIAPEILLLLQRISGIANLSIRELRAEDEGDLLSEGGADERALGAAVGNFVSEHGRMLHLLMEQRDVLKTTGGFYASLAHCLHRQRLVLDAFRAALGDRYAGVRARAADEWDGLEVTMGKALEAYPSWEEV